MEDTQGKVEIEKGELRMERIEASTLPHILDMAPGPYHALSLATMSLPTNLEWLALIPSSLTRLSLVNLHLTDESPILSVLWQFPNLSSLDLSANYIRLENSSDWLEQLKGLAFLNLGGNWLGSNGLIVLSSVILTLKQNLRILKIGKTCAVGEGLSAVLLSVTKMTLTDLDLSYNALYQVGFLAVLSVLPAFSTLISLNLDGNCFSDNQISVLMAFRDFLQFPAILHLRENFTSAEVAQTSGLQRSKLLPFP